MFESQYLLIFFAFFGGASRWSRVTKLAHDLMGRDQKDKFILSKNIGLYSFLFNFFLLIVVYYVVFTMTV